MPCNVLGIIRNKLRSKSKGRTSGKYIEEISFQKVSLSSANAKPDNGQDQCQDAEARDNSQPSSMRQMSQKRRRNGYSDLFSGHETEVVAMMKEWQAERDAQQQSQVERKVSASNCSVTSANSQTRELGSTSPTSPPSRASLADVTPTLDTPDGNVPSKQEVLDNPLPQQRKRKGVSVSLPLPVGVERQEQVKETASAGKVQGQNAKVRSFSSSVLPHTLVSQTLSSRSPVTAPPVSHQQRFLRHENLRSTVSVSAPHTRMPGLAASENSNTSINTHNATARGAADVMGTNRRRRAARSVMSPEEDDIVAMWRRWQQVELPPVQTKMAAKRKCSLVHARVNQAECATSTSAHTTTVYGF